MVGLMVGLVGSEIGLGCIFIVMMTAAGRVSRTGSAAFIRPGRYGFAADARFGFGVTVTASGDGRSARRVVAGGSGGTTGIGTASIQRGTAPTVS